MKLQIPIFICLIFVGCATKQAVENMGDLAKEVTPVVKAVKPLIETAVDVSDDIREAEDIHDWAGIAEKIAYGVSGVATLVALNEVRRRRKRAKNNG